MRRRSVDCLAQLFELLVGHPHLLSPQFEMRVKNDGEYRATCDYLACLTDRQVYLQHQKFIGGLPFAGSRAAGADGIVIAVKFPRPLLLDQPPEEWDLGRRPRLPPQAGRRMDLCQARQLRRRR